MMYVPLLSTGEILKNALLNTVLGMGTVFCVLIFISLLISLLAYIPKMQESFRKKDNEPKSSDSGTAEQSVPAAIPVPAASPENDLELIAVITAAIAASSGVPEDRFVVRSIRRRSSNNWNNTF